MIQRGEDVGFAREPRAPIGVPGEQRRQDFQRDLALQLRVARAIDLAHPARAEGSENLVGTKVSAGCQPHASRLILAMKWLGAKARRRTRLTGHPPSSQGMPTDQRT